MENIKDWMQLIQFVVFIGVTIFGIFFYFAKPDQRASSRLDNIETSCPLKHDKINYIIGETKSNIKKLAQSMKMIQENDLKHIESEQRRMSDIQTEILTILRERKIT